jgi:hypothetical protein
MPPSPGAISPTWNCDLFVEENMVLVNALSSALKEEAAKPAAHSRSRAYREPVDAIHSLFSSLVPRFTAFFRVFLPRELPTSVKHVTA